MRILPFAALLVGCTELGGPLEGVWMIEAANAEEDCVTETTSNLRQADEPEPGEPSEWTDLSDYSESLDIFFVRIAHGRGDDVVMLVNDQIIPGEKLDGETWNFEYEAETVDTDGDRHASGYEYRHVASRKFVSSYKVSRVGNRYLEGEFDFRTIITDTYTETDEWDFEEVGFGFGDLPAYLALAPDNLDTEDDCLDATCEVVTKTTCTTEAGMVGTFTGLDGDSSFDIEDNSSTPLF